MWCFTAYLRAQRQRVESANYVTLQRRRRARWEVTHARSHSSTDIARGPTTIVCARSVLGRQPDHDSISVRGRGVGGLGALSQRGPGLTYVALGDSWVEGAHCGGCRTFAGLYADGLEVLTGEPVEFIDLTGDRTTDSTALLESLRTDDEIRAAVADADVVLIATGPNEGSITTEPLAAGTCGGATISTASAPSANGGPRTSTPASTRSNSCETASPRRSAS